jgi:hypothetical protein
MSIDYAKYLIRKGCLAEADDAESTAEERISWPFPVNISIRNTPKLYTSPQVDR